MRGGGLRAEPPELRARASASEGRGADESARGLGRAVRVRKEEKSGLRVGTNLARHAAHHASLLNRAVRARVPPGPNTAPLVNMPARGMFSPSGPRARLNGLFWAVFTYM